MAKRGRLNQGVKHAPSVEQTTALASAPSAPLELSLSDALLNWCDLGLRHRAREAQQRFNDFRQDMAIEIKFAGQMLKPLPPDIREIWKDNEKRLLHDIDRAAAALVDDLCRRLENEEIFLHGYPSSDEPPKERYLLPGHRAAEFDIYVPRGAVMVAGQRFLRVTACRQRLAQLWAMAPWLPASKGQSEQGKDSDFTPVVAPEVERQAPLPDTAPAAGDTVAEPLRRDRGRGSSEPVIRQALLDNWAVVESHVATRGGGPPIWSELARTLRKRMLRPDGRRSLEVVPHEQTIRTRLPKIYAALLSEKAVRN